MKLRYFICLLLLLVALQSNAMFRSLYTSVTRTKTVLTISVQTLFKQIGTWSTTPLKSFFYGAYILHNADTKKTIILLADVHKTRKTDNIQQEEVINLANRLKADGQTVHTIVEDKGSFMKERYNLTNDFILSAAAGQTSPLLFLEEKCRNNNISCTNVEFRDDWNTKITCHILNDIEGNNNKNIVKTLHINYFGNTDFSLPCSYKDLPLFNASLIVSRRSYPALDINILNAIKTNTSTDIVCAGGDHITSVANILNKNGYTHIQQIFPNSSLVRDQKDTGTIIDVPVDQVVYFPNIAETVYQRVKSIKDYPKRSYFYHMGNQF